MKYKNHPSIITFHNKFTDKGSFNFTEFDQKQIEKEVLKLDLDKVLQSSDISINSFKENTDIFCNFLYNSFNNSIKLQIFS